MLRFSGNPASYATKLTGAAAGILLSALDGVAEYKKAGGFTPQFFRWAATTAAVTAVAIPAAGALAGAAIAASPVWGTVGVIALVSGGLYLGVRSVAQNLVEAFADEPDSLLYTSAKTVLDYLETFEGSVGGVLGQAVSMFISSAQAGELNRGVDRLQVDNIQTVGANAAGFTYNDAKTWLWGEDNGVILGGDENNWLFHTGYGEASSGNGDDSVIGFFPSELKKGEKIGKALPAGVDDTRRVADRDYTLTLDGGAGNDWVLAIGGEKATTLGGMGRDWIWNTSNGGVIYGDTIDGIDPSTGGKVADTKENSDNIWFSANTVVMDAQKSDVLKFYGLPMTGGNAEGGIPGLSAFGGFGAAIGLARFCNSLDKNGQFDPSLS